MEEPGDYEIVLLGDPGARRPWELQVWIRDDVSAQGSAARWCRIRSDDDINRRSWDSLLELAEEFEGRVTVLGPNSAP
jgi:hypothetical protein